MKIMMPCLGKIIIFFCLTSTSILTLSSNYDERFYFEDEQFEDEQIDIVDLNESSESDNDVTQPNQAKNLIPSINPYIYKIIQGGNILSTGLYLMGKAYWPVFYIAEAGCTLAKNINLNSSWYWKDCKMFSPCDVELNYPVLCIFDKIGDISGYVSIGFAICSLGLTAYTFHELYKQSHEL